MKLKWKFMLLISLLLTSLFLTAALLSNHFVGMSHRRTTQDLSTQLIRSKANEAGAWLTQRVRELHTISRTPTVTAMEETTLRPYIAQLSRDMDAFYGNDYGTFSINNFNGLEYISEDQTIDVSDRAYFKEMLTTDAEWIISEPLISKTDGNRIIVACYSIYGQDSEKVGFVAASISLDKLTQLTDELSFYDGKSFILADSGVQYTNADHSISDEVMTQMIRQIPRDGSTDVMAVELPDHDMMVFYASIPGSPGWHLATLVETGKLYADTRLLTSSLAGIWLAMLLTGILASLLLSHLVTRRVTLLTEATERVRQGDLDTTLTVSGQDEISRLAVSFNAMLTEIRHLMEQVLSNQQQKRRRELEILQAQINPHFIYNTLDTLQWKALEHGASEVADLILSLSSFFRISLSAGQEIITLGKELEHVRSYLEIQSQRYAEVLSWQINCNEELKARLVPKIIIQPLVENALYHGLKPKMAKGSITVSVTASDDRLLIEVRDDGVGIPAARLLSINDNLTSSSEKASFGLFNVHQRLQLYFGKEYGILLASQDGVGTTATLSLPLKGDPHV